MVFALAGVSSRELGIAAGMPSSIYACAGSSGGVLPTKDRLVGGVGFGGVTVKAFWAI
jgi:hypothetical protein